MKIVLAKAYGFCMGVKRAIALAEKSLSEVKAKGGTLYCLHELVHNRLVVDKLKADGMRFVDDLSEVPSGGTVLFSAHGVSPKVVQVAKSRGLTIIDATCPFVELLHGNVRKYAKEGYTIFLIGKRTHDEVIGVAGEAEESVIVIQNLDDAKTVTPSNQDKVVVLTQTTLAKYQIEPIIAELKNRFANLVLPDKSGICSATTERQEAVRELAAEADCVIVLGSKGSANSNRLADVVKECGKDAYLLEDMEAVEEFCRSGALDNVGTLGITAGASTPDRLIDNVYQTVSACARRRPKARRDSCPRH